MTEVTLIHDDGSQKRVRYLRVVAEEDSSGFLQTVGLIQWPLGEIFPVHLSSGRIEPGPGQPAALASWRVDAAGLTLMQDDLRARLADWILETE